MQGSSKKILIVDDDVTMRRLLRRLLDQEYCLAEASQRRAGAGHAARVSPPTWSCSTS